MNPALDFGRQELTSLVSALTKSVSYRVCESVWAKTVSEVHDRLWLDVMAHVAHQLEDDAGGHRPRRRADR